MSNSIFVSCPICGALGKAGQPCEFCGTTIPESSGITNHYESSVVVERQMVSAEEFASKISKYHNVAPWKDNLSVVSIGRLKGAINRNGDLVFPLNYSNIIITNGYCVLDRSIYSIKEQLLRKDVLPDNSLENVEICEGLENQLFIQVLKHREYCRSEYGRSYIKFDLSHLLYDTHDEKIALRYDFTNNGEEPFYGIITLPEVCGYIVYPLGSGPRFFISTTPFEMARNEECMCEINKEKGTIEVVCGQYNLNDHEWHELYRKMYLFSQIGNPVTFIRNENKRAKAKRDENEKEMNKVTLGGIFTGILKIFFP